MAGNNATWPAWPGLEEASGDELAPSIQSSSLHRETSHINALELTFFSFPELELPSKYPYPPASNTHRVTDGLGTTGDTLGFTQYSTHPVPWIGHCWVQGVLGASAPGGFWFQAVIWYLGASTGPVSEYVTDALFLCSHYSWLHSRVSLEMSLSQSSLQWDLSMHSRTYSGVWELLFVQSNLGFKTRHRPQHH